MANGTPTRVSRAVPLERMYANSMRLINERIHGRTLLPAVLAHCTGLRLGELEAKLPDRMN